MVRMTAVRDASRNPQADLSTSALNAQLGTSVAEHFALSYLRKTVQEGGIVEAMKRKYYTVTTVQALRGFRPPPTPTAGQLDSIWQWLDRLSKTESKPAEKLQRQITICAEQNRHLHTRIQQDLAQGLSLGAANSYSHVKQNVVHYSQHPGVILVALLIMGVAAPFTIVCH